MSSPAAKTQARAEEELHLIYGLTRRALACQSNDEFWPILAEELVRFFRCDRVSCFFVDGGQLISQLASGLKEKVIVEMGEGIAGHVAQTQKTYLSDDPYSDPKFSKRFDQLTGYKTQNILCAAFQHEGRAVGVIELFNKPGGFDAWDLRSLEWISPHVGFILDKLSADQKRRELEAQVTQTAKMSTLGFLVGGIIHDINNPLTAIKSSASLAKSIAPKNENLQGSIDIVLEACKRCEGIISGLLAFIRKYDVALGPVSVQEAAASAVKLAEYKARSARVKIVNDIPADLPPALASADQLLQVVLNLIINAVQAMPQGGHVTLEARKEGGKIVLTVTDTGIGMEPETLRKIFQPFFTTKPVGVGTGLGLSICQSMMEKFKGTLSASSDGKGKGSRFTVTLDAA